MYKILDTNEYFDVFHSYTSDPLPGVDNCGQRTENEERLFLPRIAGRFTYFFALQ